MHNLHTSSFGRSNPESHQYNLDLLKAYTIDYHLVYGWAEGDTTTLPQWVIESAASRIGIPGLNWNPEAVLLKFITSFEKSEGFETNHTLEYIQDKQVYSIYCNPESKDVTLSYTYGGEKLEFKYTKNDEVYNLVEKALKSNYQDLANVPTYKRLEEKKKKSIFLRWISCLYEVNLYKI